MLIEDFANSISSPIRAIELINNYLKYEIEDNYSELRKIEGNFLSKIKALICINKVLIKDLSNKQGKINKIINENYSKLLNNEFSDDFYFDVW